MATAEARALPVFGGRDELLRLVKQHRVVIVLGETGCGKTTQIPQYLLNAGLAGDGAIAITQPRRVAAITVAQRVSEELGVDLGSTVGYCVRFDDRSSNETVVRYMTDGMLLREALLDPALSLYSVIVLDEAHERSVGTDTLLGLMRGLLRKREDLRVVIMSATLDAERFSEFFDGAPIAFVKGRQYGVELFYAAVPQSDYVDATLVTILQIHLEQPVGDILAFMTGQEEIESLAKVLDGKAKSLPDDVQQIVVCPLFGALSPEKQLRAFQRAPPGTRKVILATNVAESSVTINGVRYVIDCGLVKMRFFSPQSGMESLIVVPVSKAQAAQRAGRAGREGPGQCYRLGLEADFDALNAAQIPEIRRCNVSSVVLQLAALGVGNPLDFDFMDPPPRAMVEQAMLELWLLRALDGEMTVTALGRQLSRFPLDPKYSRVMVEAKNQGIVEPVATIVAMLSVENVFFAPFDMRERASRAKMRLADPESDHLTLLLVYTAFCAAKGSKEWCHENFVNRGQLRYVQSVRAQLIDLCETGAGEPTSRSQARDSHNASVNSVEIPSPKKRSKILRCLVAGLFGQVAVLRSSAGKAQEYRTVLRGQTVKTTKHYMRSVSRIDPQWLPEAAGHVFERDACMRPGTEEPEFRVQAAAVRAAVEHMLQGEKHGVP